MIHNMTHYVHVFLFNLFSLRLQLTSHIKINSDPSVWKNFGIMMLSQERQEIESLLFIAIIVKLDSDLTLQEVRQESEKSNLTQMTAGFLSDHLKKMGTLTGMIVQQTSVSDLFNMYEVSPML